ncbi:MAG TPA: PD-(D/E)XK nuclease family protein [Solirubrobacteraceae bacterium]|jgi:ATP-dependent helicase/DNAse subunit B|nr:PD-(D/E)XK nuclease family protein [Solirubrobacteraceae bacterium]
MPIRLVTGPANSGKAQVLLDAVRRHVAHAEEPLLIVPTRADAEHYLRELAGEQTAMGVRVERFAGLIAEAVRRAGIAEPVLGGLARERLLAALASRAGSPTAARGMVRALGELFAELQAGRVTPQRFQAALASWVEADGAAVPAELGSLYAAYRAALERLGRLDGEQRAVAAFDALRERPSLWGGTPVLFYGFDDLTRLQLDAIDTLGRVVAAKVTVSLAYEPARVAFAGRAATFQTLAPLADEHLALEPRADHYAPMARAALSHVERRLFELGAARVDPGSAVRLLEGGGERAELELVASEVRGLLEGGMRAEEIAVLARPAGTSLDLLEEVFAAAAIPFDLHRRGRFADTAVGRALLGALRCVAAPDGAAAGELGDLLAWLRAPGSLAHPELADRLELSARRAGALGAERARELWEERNWRLETIDRLAAAQQRGAASLLEAAARELYWLFCAPRRAEARVLARDERQEAGALAAGRRALAELRELAKIDRELAPSTAAELALALEQVDLDGGRTGSVGTIGAVAVLDPLALRARRVRALFVCGLQEGVFPAPARPGTLLADDERRRLGEVAGLPLEQAKDALAAERYLFYAALSRPEEQLILSWHVADDDGDACSRSLFVDDLCDLFEEDLSESARRRPLGAVDGLAEIGEMLGADGGEEPLRDELLLERLRTHVWSASSIERWVGCPVAWFVERMLHPRAFDPDPEPLARGGLAHAALKDTLEALRRDTGSARLTAATLPRARELLARALAENEPSHPLSVVPARRTAVRRRLHVDLERYLAHAAQQDSPLEPLELELGFGIGADDDRGEPSTLPAFELPGGMKLRGRIDRVDVSEAGDAVVYDYKASKAPAAAKWIKDGSLQVALYMRAVEQLLGLPVAGGFYQPLSGDELRARGVLDRDSELELDIVRTDVCDHAEVRELLDEAVEAAGAAALEAGRGQLEPRARTCAFRGGCQYPTICRSEG